MNFENFNKEELLEYKKILEDIKKEKMRLAVSVPCAALSFGAFAYCANYHDITKSIVCALATVLIIKGISNSSKELENMKVKKLKLEEKGA